MKTRWPIFPRHRQPLAAGFTFIEVLVVMAVILVLGALAVANFGVTLKRAKLQGDATAIANSIQRARSVAVRRSRTVVVEIDSAALDLTFFFDQSEPENLTFEAGTDELAMPSLQLSPGNQPASSVRFWSRDDDSSPDPANAMHDFTSRPGDDWPVLVIEPDGSIRDLGGIRIGMGPDPSADLYDGNFMEVAVVTAATGRTELRKLIPNKTPPYEPRKQTPDGPNWKFY
jgi:prepilin-type N-terminal cleavage/methylation domain-containing protein